MKALRCHRYGPATELSEVLAIEDMPEPEPGPGEVVVDVAAAAINFTDVLFIADRYQVSVPVPFTPGSEFAGVVSAVGPDVAAVRPGDAVAGGAMSGAFAERVLVPAGSVNPLPEGTDLAVAAASRVTHSTAYSALRSVAEAAPGEWVAITGAAGGVGSACVTLARALGARALAVVSTPDKAAFCAGLGADAVLDLSALSDTKGADVRGADVKGRVREITGGGADVVLDMVGGDLAETLIRAMRRRGRFVTLGYASGVIPRIPLNLLLLKGVCLLGFEIRGFAEHEPELAARDTAELAELYRRGIGATVTARYPLDRAAEALRAVADRTATGKIILLPGK